MPETTWARKRAQIAAKSRHHPDADLTNDRAELRALRLEEHVRKVLAEAPRPTDDQLARIAALLRAGGGIS